MWIDCDCWPKSHGQGFIHDPDLLFLEGNMRHGDLSFLMLINVLKNRSQCNLSLKSEYSQILNCRLLPLVFAVHVHELNLEMKSYCFISGLDSSHYNRPIYVALQNFEAYTKREAKQREAMLKANLKAGLASLPEPEYQYEITMPDVVEGDEKGESLPLILQQAKVKAFVFILRDFWYSVLLTWPQP